MNWRVFSPTDRFDQRRAIANLGRSATAIEMGFFEDVGDDFTGPVYIQTLPALGDVIDNIGRIG